MEEIPSQNTLVQRLTLPLDLHCSGPVTHSGDIPSTGKSHKMKLDGKNYIPKGKWNQGKPLRDF
jgi:hypothetical protein